MILFRCDSSHRIGTGHVIRCLHLAKMLREGGKEVRFLCGTDEGNINEKIINDGFQLHTVDNDSLKQSDLTLVSDLKPEWLVIDSYEIQKPWEEKVPSCVKVFVIDDLMNREHQCQVLLDQNFRKDSSRYQHLVSDETKLLLGPHYCLLSPDLERRTALSLPRPPYKVLVFFGGTDSTGESLKFLEALKNRETKLQFTIVVLSSHKNLKAIQDKSLPAEVTLKIDPQNWYSLIKQHDLYLGSGGTVTWERMYLGLPGAVISVAPNQDEPSKDLAEAGYQVYLGPASQINYQEVLVRINNLLDKPTEINEMASRGLNLVNRFSKALVKEIFG